MSDIGMKLWQSGIGGDVPQFFSDIPLRHLKPLGDEFLTATVERDTEDGRESLQFVFERKMLIDSVGRMPLAIRDAMLDTTGALSGYLRFDLVASLTEPQDDTCPLFVEKIVTSAATKAALMPLDEVDEDLHEDNEAEEWDELYFPIAIDYKPMIDSLITSCDLLLRRPNLEPCDISYIGKLKYALSRLPLTTDGIGFDVLLSHKTDNEGSWGGLSLELRTDRFSVGYIGYIRGPFGGDSDCRGVYECESCGYRSDIDEDPATVYNAFEDWIIGWQSVCSEQDMNFKITDDNNDFDWDQLEDECAWDEMPSNYA